MCIRDRKAASRHGPIGDVSRRQLFGLPALDFGQRGVDVDQSWSRQKAFGGDMAKALLQDLIDSPFPLIGGREGGMTAFGF